MQRCSVSVVVQENPMFEVHPVTQAELSEPIEQLGSVPPVRTAVAQQPCPPVQSLG